MRGLQSALLSGFVLVLVGSAICRAVPLPAIKCAKGDSAVSCVLNPCSLRTCEAKAGLTCLPLYCSKATTYQGNAIPGGRPCTQVWFDAATKKVVPCQQAACPQTYKPVCGVNKKTYANKCLANADKVKVAFSGLCIFPPTCSKKYAPVCSKAGVVWPTACSAKYNGATTYTDGICLGGACASCVPGPGPCAAAHRCKGNAKYRCESSPCETKQILDNGTRVLTGMCGTAVYRSVATGFPAAACWG